MRHSQSHLSSLATLLQNAEARHSAMPASPPVQDDDSGLIDIRAMQKRAQDERESAAMAATRTPVPVVTTVRSASTDPDFAASLAGTRRKKQMVFGAILAGAGILAIAIGAGSLRRAHARVAVVEPPVAATPAPPPPAPTAPPPVVTPTVQPSPPAAPEPFAATAPVKAKSKKHKASHSSKSKGPKLTKVTSGGTEP